MTNIQIKSFDEYKEQYKLSVENPEQFWGDIAEHFSWKKKWNNVLEWNFKDPNVSWFKGGKLNITENILEENINYMGSK
jgi:acetyl-CoA synthetase